MKSIFRLAGVIMLSTLVFLTGCEKDEDDPFTNDRDKFLGSWQGESTGSGGTRNFNMNFTASNSAPDQILMENFDGAGSGTFVPAVVSGSSFTIIQTTVSGEVYEGSGSFSNNQLSFTFTVDDGQTVDNRSGTAHR